jgi:hypothetical protein
MEHQRFVGSCSNYMIQPNGQNRFLRIIDIFYRQIFGASMSVYPLKVSVNGLSTIFEILLDCHCTAEYSHCTIMHYSHPLSIHLCGTDISATAKCSDNECLQSR